jgi:hypothetical protein
MNDIHPLRRTYDAAEREIAPRLAAFLHSGEFTTTTTWITKARKRIGGGLAAAGARIWHLVNLPAGTDVKRLRTHLGSLDREVRQIRLQLEQIQFQAIERGSDNHGTTTQPERSTRPGTPRARP